MPGNNERVPPRRDLQQKTLFRIGEVSRITATKPFVLRYWETEFPMLQPVKAPSGHRLYRRQDVETVLEIKRLLYEEGFTIAGARKHLVQRRGNGGAQGVGGPFTFVAGERKAAAPAGGVSDRKWLSELREELRAILTLLEGK